jgi:ribosomal protein S18 acetylase RimI-like enzyme
MVKIRKMIAQDRDVIFDIISKTDMFTQAEIDVAMELIDIFLTKKEQQDYLIYVAENKGKEVVGYVCYGPTPATEGTFDLYWIAVSPTMQGKGIGKELLSFTENYVLRQKGRLIIIETSSQSKYQPTQQFYIKNKYIIEARIKDFYRRGDDRLIFVKRLTF